MLGGSAGGGARVTMTEPVHYRSLAAVAADIRSGQLSSEEVIRHTLERISALEPSLHAFAEVRFETALAEARDADARRARGEALGPLHGVPIAVKDLCAMAGTKTRAGGFFPTRFGPSDTATVVRRLQAAGAVIVGKTQLTEGAWGTHHPDIIAPVNPWAPDRWTGVSSSGSGVSVAAGLAFGAIGTDTAGSIRFPSACNHLVGLKPTWGRVSRHGIFPLSETFDHVGPMARSVADVALMFQAIAGADPLDPTSLVNPVADCVAAVQAADLRGVKVGVDPVYSLSGLDEPTTTLLKAAIGRLEAAGGEIIEVSLPDVRPFLERAVAAAFVEAANSHAASYPSEKALYSATYSALLDIGRAASAMDYAAIALWRREFHGRLMRLFGAADVLVVPVVPIMPPTVAEMAGVASGSPLGAAQLTAYTIPFNLAGVPSLTLPMGLAPCGAPLGFQLIGPDLAEAALLSAGSAYEAAAGCATLHPLI
jgi:amidase